MGETNTSRLRRETRLQCWLPKTALPHELRGKKETPYNRIKP
ncbi:hypothetical protein [Calothrix rhizosoleniae]|nr:hypothetical protein [Calothrix rhizosoleniae]